MPRATDCYLFERRILDCAQRQCERLPEFAAQTGFLLEFRPNGATSLQTDRPTGGWQTLSDELRDEGIPHLIYDPFDAPEYVALQWHAMTIAQMEEWIGSPFEDADFVRHPRAGQPTASLSPPGQFPPDWSVVL